ncbi:MAG: hypothetical protein FWG75_10160 [Cystobacterineae bacterium]|nr:hypothetical protein [Cystobacterineae bacterium]
MKPLLLKTTLLMATLFSLACGKDDDIICGSCGGDGTPWAQVGQPSAADTATVKARTIFFAHKSVGENIVTGIENNSSMDVQRVWANQLNSIGSTTAFYHHDMVPPNSEPMGKITAFENALDAMDKSGNTVDIALMKFCYADFYSNAKVNEVFTTYKNTLAKLQQRFPKVLFLHVTVPLERSNSGPREEFNALLRETYGEKLFDLATLESIRPDKSIAQQNDIIVLASEWTSDGGHLNAAGQKHIAGSLISFLANAKLNK